MAMKSYTLTDLFSGCGGMTQGFVATRRFRPLLAVEADKDAAYTYGENFGHDHVLAERIEDVPAWPKVDVVIGGPPCQGFSTLNRNGVGPERRTLWRHYFKALRDSHAKAFVMENVPQLIKSPEYREFRKQAFGLGYRIAEDVLLAADYGVPQLRRRAIVIGIRDALPKLPLRTHHAPGVLPLDGEEWRTFEWAVTHPTPLPLEPDGRAWHRARNPSAISRERYRAIPGRGEGRFELAARRPDITPPCWLNKTKGTTDVFGRMWADRPSPTIRTEFYKPEKGRYLHPTEHRPITVREAARLMSFPDEFKLPESQSMTSVARQLGNAVPPLLAEQIAKALVAVLDAEEGLAVPETAVVQAIAA